MPRDIFRSDVRARAPFNIPRGPNVPDMRGNEQAEMAAVESVSRFAQSGAAMLLSENTKKEAYKVQAETAFLSYKNKVAGPREAWKTTKLSGAADAYPEYTETVKQIMKETGANLHPEAKKLYERAVMKFNGKLIEESEGHLAREFVKTKIENAKVDERLAVQEAMLNPYDDESRKAVASAIYNRIVTEGGTSGITEDETWARQVDMRLAQDYSAFMVGHLNQLADKPGDGVFAEQLYEREKKNMTFEDRGKVENNVRRGSLRDQGQALAQTAFSAHPDNPLKGYADIGRIQRPELRAAALTEFNRIVSIDKQNTSVRRSGSWNGFHQLLDGVEPGSDQLQEQVADVRNYISSIPDKLNNLGGPKTLKQQMQEVLDNKLKPGKKVSDEGYKAQLMRAAQDINTFSVMDIDHQRLSSQDSKAFITMQQGMLTGDAKAIKAMKSASGDFYAIIDNELMEAGIIQAPTGSGPAAERAEKRNKAIADLIAEEFFEDLMDLRNAYGAGAEFKDPNTMANIRANKELMQQKVKDFVKRFKAANPGLLEQPSRFPRFFNPSKTSATQRLEMLENRQFVRPDIGEKVAPPTVAPPATRTQREDSQRDAKTLMDSLNKLRKSTERSE